jgi:aryl-alcohol dehydrogenase-like predicted oxidoreductase
MEKRKLGRSGLSVSELCFGGNVFGWTADEATSFELLDAYLAAGGNFIDTADVYSNWAPGNKGGESETVIGKWLKARGNREQVIIATKVGMQMAPDRKGLSRSYIVQSVEDSLRRLQTDYIDLYQSHVDDEDTALTETLDTYQELIKQGKVRAIGASNYSAGRLTEALAVARDNGLPRYESLQPLYNLYDREGFEQELEEICTEEELGVMNYYSLAAGFLTGKYRSEEDLAGRARGGSAKKYLNERGLRILAAMDQVVAKHGTTHAQVALAWLLARPSVTSPIVSATSVAQLNQIVTAPAVKLDLADVTLLDQASSWQVVAK